MILVGTINIYVLFKNQLGFYVSDDPNMRNRVGQKKTAFFHPAITPTDVIKNFRKNLFIHSTICLIMCKKSFIVK